MTIDAAHVIIGTAGHIDHGKSALVKALTGTDPDTLPEEKQRGITIELGFVFMPAPDGGRQVVFIDVPGHEKLVKTMVAGASNLDAAMLVIAAEEGVKPQTAEHLDILTLLEIPAGIIALTKKDLVDDARLAAVTAQIRAFVRGTFLADAPIIPVSALTGENMDALRNAVREIGSRGGPRPDTGVFRLPVDRVFTRQGFGTVIAGTVLSGTVAAGDTVEIFPEGLRARVRGVQIHRQKAAAARIGQRAALNLPDIKKELLYRGQCAGAPDSLTPTTRLDARVRLLGTCAGGLKHRTQVRLHLGTAEIVCTVLLLEGERLEPGGTALAQLALETPTVAAPKDRFVIRALTPVNTIGGGVILDASPAAHRRADSAARERLQHAERSMLDSVEQAFLKTPLVALTAADVARAIGEREDAVRVWIEELSAAGLLAPISAGGAEGSSAARWLHARSLKDLCDRLVAAISAHVTKHAYRYYTPLADAQSQLAAVTDRRVFEAVLAEAARAERVIVHGNKITLAGHAIRWKRGEEEAARQIESIFKAAGFSTPLEADVRTQTGLAPPVFENIMSALIDMEVLVRLDEKVTYHRDTFAVARQVVEEHLAAHASVTVADLRDVLHVSRKYTLPLLEYLDRIRVTKRVGDARISMGS